MHVVFLRIGFAGCAAADYAVNVPMEEDRTDSGGSQGSVEDGSWDYTFKVKVERESEERIDVRWSTIRKMKMFEECLILNDNENENPIKTFEDSLRKGVVLKEHAEFVSMIENLYELFENVVGDFCTKEVFKCFLKYDEERKVDEETVFDVLKMINYLMYTDVDDLLVWFLLQIRDDIAFCDKLVCVRNDETGDVVQNFLADNYGYHIIMDAKRFKEDIKSWTETKGYSFETVIERGTFSDLFKIENIRRVFENKMQEYEFLTHVTNIDYFYILSLETNMTSRTSHELMFYSNVESSLFTYYETLNIKSIESALFKTNNLDDIKRSVTNAEINKLYVIIVERNGNVYNMVPIMEKILSEKGRVCTFDYFGVYSYDSGNMILRLGGFSFEEMKRKIVIREGVSLVNVSGVLENVVLRSEAVLYGSNLEHVAFCQEGNQEKELDNKVRAQEMLDQENAAGEQA